MPIDIQMTTEQGPGPAIHVQALEKSYDELHVLRGVDFDVARARRRCRSSRSANYPRQD